MAGPQHTGVEYAETFETITHACSLEGGATLVNNSHSSAFLTSFIEDRGSNIYFPLALVARKEFLDLTRLVQGSQINIEHSDNETPEKLEEKVSHLVRLQERVLNFRLTHYNSIASYSQNHNSVQAAWRRSFHIQALKDDLSEDIAEASSYLSSLQEQVKEERFRKWTGIVAACAAFVAGSQTASYLLSLFEKGVGWAGPEMQAAAKIAEVFGEDIPIVLSPAYWGVLSTGSTLAFGLIVACLAYLHTIKRA